MARRPPGGGPWPHPLLAVDAHTIVTGSADALRKLVERGGDAKLASGPMELLLKDLSPGGDLAVMVDLAPASGRGGAGQLAGRLAGRQRDVALALRDPAGLGTFGPVDRPMEMRTGAGLQRRDDG